MGQVIVDLEPIVADPAELLIADRELRQARRMGDEPGARAGHGAVAAERDEQALHTVGAVDRAQQIEPQSVEDVAAVLETLDSNAVGHGRSLRVVPQAVNKRHDDVDAPLAVREGLVLAVARPTPRLARIVRAAVTLDHEHLSGVREPALLARAHDQPELTHRRPLIDQIDRRCVDAITPVARGVEPAKARQQPLAPVDAGDALEPEFDVAALDPAGGDPELPRHAGHRHRRR